MVENAGKRRMEHFFVAQKLVVEIIDDLDGTVITDGKGGTVRFSVDDRSYEIDLCRENAKKLDGALAPFVAKARRSGTGKSISSAKKPRARKSDSAVKDLREWARANGYAVPDRGRISQQIHQAYLAAK
jgi:hypothetical protein